MINHLWQIFSVVMFVALSIVTVVLGLKSAGSSPALECRKLIQVIARVADHPLKPWGLASCRPGKAVPAVSRPSAGAV
jgi:uncharacterized protein YjeT (DUF2065 family)